MGVIVAKWLIEKVVGVKRFNDKLTKLNTNIEDVVWKVVSYYCPRVGRSVNEREGFYELMDKVVIIEKGMLMGMLMIVNKAMLMIINGHVGSVMGGFREVHGVFGTEQINNGGVRLLD